MELEQRVEVLEHEMKMLKGDIQKTLAEIRASLPERPVSTQRWQKQAWALALLNVVLAFMLFTNIYLYVPGLAPFEIDSNLAVWLRAFWVALALIWLLLQLYPLALLLQQEDAQSQGIGWRNAASFFKTHPGFVVGLTLAVLLVALVNAVVPAAWIVATLVLLVAVGSLAMHRLLAGYRRQAHGRN